MTVDPGFIVIVGALAGGLAAWTGLGAGLSFGLLALAGVPLPGALFVSKLTCAGTDASAWLASTGARKTDARPFVSRHLLSAIMSGSLGALCVIFLPGWIAAGVWGAALLGAGALNGSATSAVGSMRAGSTGSACPAHLARRTAAAHAWRKHLLGIYIGACGIGAGLIQLTLARVARRDAHAAQTERRVLGTGANLGSAALLAALTPVALGDLAWPLWLLALSQAIGAGLVGRLLSRHTARACATMPDPIQPDQIPR